LNMVFEALRNEELHTNLEKLVLFKVAPMYLEWIALKEDLYMDQEPKNREP